MHGEGLGVHCIPLTWIIGEGVRVRGGPCHEGDGVPHIAPPDIVLPPPQYCHPCAYYPPLGCCLLSLTHTLPCMC